jgi:inorganic phosphate transporter, PiT family
MSLGIWLFAIVVLLAFLYGLINGFMDGGGLVSTVIMTRVMEPLPALLWVAVGELAGLFLLGHAVAEMLTKNMIRFPQGAPRAEMLAVLIAAMMAALIWNTLMWRRALPSSSSHALVGAIVGAVAAGYGVDHLSWPMFTRIFIFLGLVPIFAALLALIFSKLSYWLGAYVAPSLSHLLRGLQIATLGGMAMVHGSNDGQKTLAMMLLAAAALGNGTAATHGAPIWMMVLCGGALALGVIFGSQRIVSTVGRGLYRIEPLQGFCAGTSSMLLVGASSLLGYPMSTTHVMSTSVLGAGVALRPRAVRWTLVGEIATAWLVTIPSVAIFAAVLAKVFLLLLRA